MTKQPTNRLEQLKQLFPETIINGQVDFSKLQQILGDNSTESETDFGLHWLGKSDIFKDIEHPISTNLLLAKAKSINPQNTENQFIEGENLEVLRHLQHTHKEAVKLIYIDPPYNTGNDHFVYSDNFIESKANWHENDRENERFHANWLSMMYARLTLARNLLREDGAIFLSIDDNELYHLKLILDEIFGEQNFIATMVRQCKVGSGHDSGHVAVEYDYVVFYAKNKSELKAKKQTVDTSLDKKYRYEDAFVEERGKYYLRDLDYKGTYSASMDFPLEMPDGTTIYSGGKHGQPNTWRWSKEKVEWGKLPENDFIVFKKRPKGWKAYIKQYQFVDNKGNRRERKLPYRALVQFLNGEGTKDIRDLFGEAVFSFPKSVSLLTYLISMVCDDDDTVLDFFAGSSTTAHAVLKINHEQQKNLNFICVQIPENLPAKSAAKKAGFETLSELSFARICKVIEQLGDEQGVQFLQVQPVVTHV
ncbi:MAG: site-specific DNA-methyltransferase [Saprospiraceae bacterium]